MRMSPALAFLRSSVSVLLVTLLLPGGFRTISAAPLQDVTINVVSGQNLELVLGSSTTKEVTVQVLDSSGKPAVSVGVSFVFPEAGRAGGTTDSGQFFATGLTDQQGQVSVKVKPTGSGAGSWSLRVTAGQKTITIPVNNVMNPTKAPVSDAQPGAGTPASTPTKPEATTSTPSKSHTGLIVAILVVAAGGGAAAALAGKKGSSSSSSTGTTTAVSTTTGLTIGLGNGSFTTPPGH